MNVETIGKICESLPNVEKEIKWKSDLAFMVGRKMFCIYDLESYPPSAAFKVPTEDFEELSAQMYFKPAPYFAQHHWVTVVDLEKVPPADLQRHIETSYRLVKAKLSKKVLKDIKP
ncbi:MAG TPA: MmcQ/YjbR family DNA-binding protein [Flavobacterium sp.]|jgi:predicted DNA-binding protein (MmcQ/YjbR family)